VKFRIERAAATHGDVVVIDDSREIERARSSMRQTFPGSNACRAPSSTPPRKPADALGMHTHGPQALGASEAMLARLIALSTKDQSG
jgi:hypothetical protein